ncbi:MAG: biopolymer transporter ExbD [Chitinophagales bacterium]|nr:biopolymer transporter ExbD [Chitinophagales bacterium]
MKFRREKRQHSEVNAGALSDILFFLLLFFLIVSTLASATAIKLKLPKSSQGKSVPSKPIYVSVSADLHYYVNQKEILLEQLAAELENEKTGKDTPPTVVLRAEGTVQVQQLVDLMDVINDTGLPIVIATDKKK